MNKETPCTPSTPIVWAYCCRVWPIVVGYRVGLCGLCGMRPGPLFSLDDFEEGDPDER